MKVISYSLFGEPTKWEFGYYLRGIYFNVRMNRILMPGWQTRIYLSNGILNKFYPFFKDLDVVNKNIALYEENDNPQHCLGMLWRMKPLFDKDVEVVLCRDADSVITYREAQINNYFVQSPMLFHGINDNDAHGGLMGGLVGFKAEGFRQKTGYQGFNTMVAGLDLRKHGSDQDFLNKTVYPKIKNWLMMHIIKGAGASAPRLESFVPTHDFVPRKYWVSDLVSRYIGSAGVIDFELLRFFHDHDSDGSITAFEKAHAKICYWRNLL